MRRGCRKKPDGDNEIPDAEDISIPSSVDPNPPSRNDSTEGDND